MLATCSIAALLIGWGDVSLALPENGRVAEGQAQIVVTSPTELQVVQTTPRVIIEWDAFNIAANEVVRFLQSSSVAQALNRVLGPGSSQILGQLIANGHVAISNPAGVAFGPNAKVDVGALIATTANIPNADFMAGRLNFSLPGDPKATVANEGTITIADGGIAALVAPWVRNSGTIVVRLGKIALGSAETFTVDLFGDKLIQFAVDRNMLQQVAGGVVDPGAARVVNTGNLVADGGSIQISAATARDIVANAINMDGIARAQSVAMVNGEIVLSGGESGIVTVAGALDASGARAGERGGSISILGNKIAVMDNARIVASGDSGGGRVLIGGNMRGEGLEPNAARTYVAANAKIEANAQTRGDGGMVVVWADDATHFAGTIQARGGAEGGNGGMVEVSGKRTAQFAGQVDLGAPKGATGTLLLDPRDIVIQGGTGDGTADSDAATNSFGGATAGTVLFGEFAGGVTIRESEIEGLNANIVLEAAHSITGTGTFGTNRLDVTSGNSLTLRTRNDPGDETGSAYAAGIDVSGIPTIRTQGGGSITLGTGTGTNSATGSVAQIRTAALTAVGGAITLDAGNGGVITTGAVASTGGAAQAGGAITVSTSGAATLGAITASGGTAGAGNPGRNAGAVSVTGADVTVTSVTASGSAGSGAGTAGGDGAAITLAATDATPTVTLGGNLTAQGGNPGAGGTPGTGGAVNVTGATILTANAAVNTSGGTGGAGGTISFGSTINGNAAGRTLTLTGGTGDVTVGGAVGGGLALGSLTVTGNDIALAGIGTTGTAGVTGATSATASTAASDTGSITLGGTAYHANAQTYAAPAGETILMNGGAPILFKSSNDNIAFNTGTIRLGDGVDLTVDTGTGAGSIGAAGGIRGTSAETVTLVPGTGTVALGPIGSGDEIASLSIDSGTGAVTLGGDIVVADIAGNNVVINRPVTLGADVTIDADRAAHDGNVTLGGTVTGAGRAFTVRGGTIATAAITTTGGANQAGGAVTIAASDAATTGAITTTGGAQQSGGAVTITAHAAATTGAITASGGTAGGTGNPGRNAGAVSVTGADVTVTSVVAQGSAGSGAGQPGGDGAAITLAATDATPTVTLGGNLTSQGGTPGAGGVGGSGGAVHVTGATILTANATVDTYDGTGSLGGAITFTSTVDSNTGTARTLTLTAGTADVTVEGAVGGTTALSALTVTGNDIALAGIGTTGAAGVIGATSVTATTDGADVGSITLGGTAYHANAQTYAAPAGETILMNGGAPILFKSSNDNIAFNAGTIRLGDGGDLTVDTAGGAIGAGGGIRGTSAETVSLTTSGTATVTLGQIGLGDEIASLAVTTGSGATTLNGNIVVADVAGNNVSITGPVTLGADVTIDADKAVNDGNVTLGGTVTGAGRAFTVRGGTIAIGAVTTTGGTAQAGGAVTITAGGGATAGAITASGGAAGTGNPGRNAGTVSVTGADVTVTSVTASGSAGSGAGQPGGDGAAITLAATDATPTVTLGGNLTAQGGNPGAGGTPGTGGAVNVTGATILTANAAVNTSGGTGGAGGAIGFTSTIDSNTGTTRTLTLTGGTGDVTVEGAIGGTTALSTLTITGNDIALAGIGTTGAAGVTGATSVTASTAGSDTGSIALNGGARTGGTQTYGGTGLPLSFGGDLVTTNSAVTLNTATTLTGNTVIDAGTATVTIGSTVDAGGHDLTVAADEIAIGGAISGTGRLTLRQGTAGAGLDLGSTTTTANELDLSAAELGQIQTGFADVTFGRNDATGVATVRALAATDLENDVVVRAGSGGITLAGDVATGGTAVTLDGAVTLTGNRTIATSGGDITLANTVQGNAAGRTLGLQAGGGDIAATGDLGTAGVRLGAVTVDGGTIDFDGNVYASALTASSAATASFGGAVNVTGAVTVNPSVTDAAFTGGLTAGTASFLNAGTLQLGDAAGDATTVAGGGIAHAARTILAGTVTANAGGINFGAVDLAGATTLDPAAGALTLGAVTGGNNDLTIKGSGTAVIDSTTGLGALALAKTGGTVTVDNTLDAGAVTATAGAFDVALLGTTTVSGAGTFANAGTLTLGDGGDSLTFAGGFAADAAGGTATLNGTLSATDQPITFGALTLGGASAISAGQGTVTLGAVTAGANALVVTGDDLVLTGAWSGTGARTVQPGTPSRTIGLAEASGQFAVGATELGYLFNGMPSSVTIGRADGTGQTTADAFSADDPLTLRGGAIALTGTLSKPAGGLTLLANGGIAGDVDLVSGTGTLTLRGLSAVLTGTVNGAEGAAAANEVTTLGPLGPGPFTVNGAPIPGAPQPPPPPTAAEIAMRNTVTNSQVVAQVANAIGSGRIVAGADGAPNTPATMAFADTGTFAPYVVVGALDVRGAIAQGAEPTAGTATAPAGAPANGAREEQAQRFRDFMDRFMKTLTN